MNRQPTWAYRAVRRPDRSGAWPARRAFLSILAALIVAGAFATVAAAGTVNYWGYNNQTRSNPAAGAACGVVYSDGFACAGYNNWDRSQLDYNSGSAHILFGFMNCNGCLIYGLRPSSAGLYTVIRTTWNSDHPSQTVNTYNLIACAWDDWPSGSGYSYDQCRAIIF